MLTTSTRRPKIEQPQELLPNRRRVLLFRGTPVLILLSVLGRCSTTPKECFANDTTRLSTSGSQALIPQGCVVTETRAKGLAVLDCGGGRVGFMVRAKPD